ncbi:MAG: amidohydrolase family protein [Gemmatimonadota bacterium]|nr:amidohydrolase family protein [Gemmatimonadota bacterium]
MVIDIHAHVFRWPVLKKRNSGLSMMSAEEQVRRMDEKGVDKAVILPLTSAEVIGEPQSMGEVFDICRLYPGRFIPFCDFDVRRCDLDSMDAFRDVLDQYVARGAKGVGELTSRVYWDDPRLWNLFAACEDLGLPVTFHTSPPEVVTYGLIDQLGFPRFEKALQRFPNLRFFGHSASFWSEISGDLTADGKEGYSRTPVAPGGTLVRLFRTYPNLCGDLSAGSGFNALTRDPAFTFEFLDEFQDRLLLGLDHTDAELDFQHIEWLRDRRDEGHIAPDVCEKILWRNADRILGLGIAEEG